MRTCAVPEVPLVLTLFGTYLGSFFTRIRVSFLSVLSSENILNDTKLSADEGVRWEWRDTYDAYGYRERIKVTLPPYRRHYGLDRPSWDEMWGHR